MTSTKVEGMLVYCHVILSTEHFSSSYRILWHVIQEFFCLILMLKIWGSLYAVRLLGIQWSLSTKVNCMLACNNFHRTDLLCWAHNVSAWQYYNVVHMSDNGWLDKTDQTSFLDQTDYLTGNLPDQTEVQIRTSIRPDSKTFTWSAHHFCLQLADKELIYDKTSSVTQLLTSGATIQACIGAKGRYLEHLMWMFTFLWSEEKSSDFW